MNSYETCENDADDVIAVHVQVFASFFKNNILKHFTQDHSTNRILLRAIVFAGPRTRWCTKYQDFNSLSNTTPRHVGEVMERERRGPRSETWGRIKFLFAASRGLWFLLCRLSTTLCRRSSSKASAPSPFKPSRAPSRAAYFF